MTMHMADIVNPNTVAAAAAFLLNLVYAIAILVVANFAAGRIRHHIVTTSKKHQRLDATLFKFLGNCSKYLILSLAVIFVLNRFGIQTASLVALIGAAGLAVGLALQGTLSNLAAGVMLILFRPFHVGNYIDAGSKMGTVEEISLLYTELKTYDGLKAIIPNKDIWASSITNFSANERRLIDLTIGVSYSSDLRRAAAALAGVAAQDARVLQDPPPFIKVKALSESSVDFVFRVWVASAEWWVAKCEMTERIKLALDAAGVDIPFPTRTLHHVNPPAA